MAEKRKSNSLTARTGVSKSADAGTRATKKAKSESQEAMGPLDFTTPKTLIETLIHPTSFETFFSEYWEKKPLLVSRSDQPDAVADYDKYFRRLFSRKELDELVVRHNLSFVKDVNCVRYADQQRSNLNSFGRVTVSKLDKIFDRQKGTLQVHQPQRYENELWRILENLESFFGCLVGSNVYITPPQAQGLPPHHDDVEVFILQLEGEKHWKLYKPISELPQEYSGDLAEDDIGFPFMEFTLKPGDLVYFPRGTIHQAQTSEGDECSTHITISTYQKHSWGNYLLTVFPSLLNEAITSDVSFRRGLPVNFLRSSKISKSSKMHSVVDLLLQKLRYNKFLPSGKMIKDFMQNRLPPFGIYPKKLRDNMPNGIPPDSMSKVRLKIADHVCCLVAKEHIDDDSDEEDEDEEDEDDEDAASRKPTASKDVLFVYSSLYNNRKMHMFNSKSDETAGFALKFPSHFEEAMEYLKSNTDHFINAIDLPLTTDDDRESLLRGLWSSHLLEAQPSKSGRGVKAIKVE